MNYKWYKYFALIGVLVIFSAYKEPESKTSATQSVMMQILDAAHYDPLKRDDDYSHKVYDLYLKRMDPNKKFLLKEDVEKLSKYRDLIDDQINTNSFEFFDLATSLLEKRTKEVEGYIKEILSQPFEFNKEETYETEPKKISYPATGAELKDAWRKYLKYQTLIRVADQLDIQDKAKEKKDTSVHVKTIEKIEAECRKRVLTSHEEWFHRMNQVDKTDRLSLYLNCMANVYDPHTEFFPPRDKADFDIKLSGQLEGIGAQLQEKDGLVKVTSIVPGSASWKQGQLKSGDIIMKVAQGVNEPVDIANMRLDKVVELVRGKKGTEVRLTVKKPDNSIVVIPIIRDVVILEETYAQSAIVEGKKRVGYIKLPLFYADFNKAGGRSCAEDIKQELLKLRKENIDGVVLDLRNNGGGSLEDVVKMAGLFIDKGPIVQIKGRQGAPLVLEDQDTSTIYRGPLVIMVNSGSASASEILAAAMQDYKRGLIVGGNATFGKGTVQRFTNLDDFLNAGFDSLKPLGSIKITQQKFYRINGTTTQLNGVVPDIILPDPYSYIELGEKDMDYPMKWDVIPAAKYHLYNSYNADQLRKADQSRISNNESFKLVKEEANKFKSKKEATLVYLNIDKYRAEQKRLTEENKKYEPLNKEVPGMKVESLIADLPKPNEGAAADSSKTARTKEWFKNIRKDFYLNEVINIIGDMKK